MQDRNEHIRIDTLASEIVRRLQDRLVSFTMVVRRQGRASLTQEVRSRYCRFYSRQTRGLKIHFALPPIRPEEHSLRTDKRQQLIRTV